ncbi:MAG: hypothetical protein LBR73_04655, partial [Oscillospiraceae bacterium]|nr:hypothetical protein [Oscillospiraceae bacterium]
MKKAYPIRILCAAMPLVLLLTACDVKEKIQEKARSALYSIQSRQADLTTTTTAPVTIPGPKVTEAEAKELAARMLEQGLNVWR